MSIPELPVLLQYVVLRGYCLPARFLWTPTSWLKHLKQDVPKYFSQNVELWNHRSHIYCFTTFRNCPNGNTSRVMLSVTWHEAFCDSISQVWGCRNIVLFGFFKKKLIYLYDTKSLMSGWDCTTCLIISQTFLMQCRYRCTLLCILGFL